MPNNAPAAAAAAAQGAQQEAAKAGQRARDALNRATNQIQARQATQQAVRDAARAALKTAPSGIPAGLGPNGLDVDPTGAWIGGGTPTQTTQDGRTKVEIDQTQERAIFSWKSFDVSETTDVKFDQQGNTDWIALNRVTGTGVAPSRILGSITADGTVLVINQNGIIFGAGSQINVGSLMASTLDVGPSVLPDPTSTTGTYIASTIALRNQNFLSNGLLGYKLATDLFGGVGPSAPFTALGGTNNGTVKVENGASVATSDGGLILLAAPHVINAGHLKAPQGQVILAAAETALALTPSTGTGTDPVPRTDTQQDTWSNVWAASDAAVRGLVPLPQGNANRSDYYVWNQSTGLIEVPQGNIYLRAPGSTANGRDNNGGVTIGYGAVYSDGILSSTTSVSRNGSIILDAADIRLGTGSLVTILADPSDETIPQEPTSVAGFRQSVIKIGSNANRVEMQEDSLLLAPSADVTFGRTDAIGLQTILIDNGANINVAGLTDVLVPISENQVFIDPAKKNELRDSPIYQIGFLNGAKIYLDPRKSGVRDDGVAWIGSPLIDAKAYYQLVGIHANRLMTKGGTVRFGATGYDPLNTTRGPSGVIVSKGATIDISGGWLKYEAGTIRSTHLVDDLGHVVDIANADPKRTYVAIAEGFKRSNARWGIVEAWANPFFKGDRYYLPGYTEGRDAGVVRFDAGSLVLDGNLMGAAYAGVRQIAAGVAGTGKPSVAGDERRIQGAGSELPAGGALIIQGTSFRVSDAVTPLAEGEYGNFVGGGISSDGVYTRPTAGPNPPLPPGRLQTVLLSDDLISGSGLSQVSLLASVEYPSNSPDLSPPTRVGSGPITIDEGAHVSLSPGGVFRAEGTHVQVDGDITVASGTIALRTDPGGFSPTGTATPGAFDIVVNGDLSVAGRWVNDLGVASDQMQGPGWLNGGAITMEAAPNVLIDATGRTNINDYRTVVTDISGSIIIAPTAHLNLSSGGRVDANGKLNLTAKGGDLSLKSGARYYNGDSSGFRVFNRNGDLTTMPINPDSINARIAFDPASISAHGFGGGGTFSLFTPEFSFGEGPVETGARLSLDFFSQAGFSDYKITSYKTQFTPSTFTNGYGGYNATLAVQTQTIGNGETLSLVQSVLPSILSATQLDALRGLASGGDVNSLVAPIVPAAAYDQKAVNLTLGGMQELHVAEGGKIVGAAGSSLAVGGLINDGTIRIAGGTITQKWEPPVGYVPSVFVSDKWRDPIGIRDFSEVFTVNPDGTIDPNAPSKIKDSRGRTITNENLVGYYIQPDFWGRDIYMLGMLDQGQGILLSEHSVTDLSGTVLVNPLAVGVNGRPVSDGRVVGGGTLAAVFSHVTNNLPYILPNYELGGTITAKPGARIDLSGAAAVFDRRNSSPSELGGAGPYSPTPVWSDAGTLRVGAGGTFTGAIIRAEGGNGQARGGTLEFAGPVLSDVDPTTPTANVLSAKMIKEAGFDTLVAYGGISSLGDANVQLARAFLLQTMPWRAGTNIQVTGLDDLLAPVISSGGNLVIEAPYIGLYSVVDVASPTNRGTPNGGTLKLKGQQIDITGAVRLDATVTSATLEAHGDIRFTGVPSTWNWSAAPAVDPTLKGGLGTQGDLRLVARQIYPTTGSTFQVTSAGTDSTISIARSSGDLPSVPYSAGGNLTIQAAHIVQGGVIRVPFGTLSLGSNNALTAGTPSSPFVVAPVTQSVLLADGSVTSVSAGGLSIPYGTTTDTIEWYFAPTGLSPLTGPPAKVLSIGGKDITLAAGAAVDITGGGDVFAYEFVPGTGGSRDVLSRFNSDQYSSNNVGGTRYQYPDARQVYAIVPGLSDAPVAAYDPIYSADYAALSAGPGVGRRVYLSGGDGLSPGWYTLLPAQYATLPGGMRVVEQTGVKNAQPSLSLRQADGSLLVSGIYGDAISGSSESQIRLFSVMSQDVIKSYSKIVLTSGNDFTYSQAASQGYVAPRTGLDAGRLVLNPFATMRIDTVVAGAAAKGGRGSQVDIGGARIEILSDVANAVDSNAVHLTVSSLNNLSAESLLIGGTRVDNTDGTTNLMLTANSIVVANDAANPLIAPEIVLAVDDGIANPVGSQLILNDGATIIATGELSDQRSGAYIVDGAVVRDTTGSDVIFRMPANTAIGALVRASNGPQRVVQRPRTAPDPTLIGNTGTPTGPDATLVVGNVNIQGGAIGLDTSHNITVGSAAQLRGKDIALGVGRLAFTDGPAAPGTVVITPELRNILAQGEQLTLRSQTSIGFDNGTYNFKSVAFDAATITALQGGNVSLEGDKLSFSNSGAAAAATGGGARFAAVADEIIVGNGTVTLDNFGAGVDLTARTGLFSAGKSGVLDAGAGNLSITAAFIGDRGRKALYTDPATGMTLKSAGNVTITNAGLAAVDVAKIPGIPGSSLTIAGKDVSINGTHLRSTAGALTVRTSGSLALAGGAQLEAPGYTETFGDSADPQTRSAPGGTLTLAALGAGGISLGDAHLSVGNGKGNAGALKLSAANGAIAWGTATFDGRGGAGDAGGSFSLDTQGGIDLVGLNNRVGADGFTSGFEVRTRTGDVVLVSGQTLRSGSVNLTADGGRVIVGGNIDTSGVNGGDIALYGAGGVSLEGAAFLDAHAEGYPADDTRQARAGDVTLGTDFLPGGATVGSDGAVSGASGAINVAAGAKIDASAHRPGDRLVRIMRNGVVNYAYVEGDVGGTVTFRAPVIVNSSGRSIVNVAVAAAQSIVGAKAIDLVGFKRWDLEQVAASGLYKGVSYDAATDAAALNVAEDIDTANLDGTLTSVGGVNFLGDKGPGTVVDYVQGFDVSAAYGNLGGLAGQQNFHARPGVDLAATGNITLKSNWNLGAGTVNLAMAATKGYASIYPTLQVQGVATSGYVIKPDFEDELFAELTKLTYRTNGGDVRGEAPVVALRAGGNLTLNGSLTDGFFTFRDQSDKTYRSAVGLTYSNYVLTLNGGFSTSGFSPLLEWSAWNGTSTPSNYLGLSVGSQATGYLATTTSTINSTAVPYTPGANSPAALGTYTADALGNVNGGGDPIGSGVVFPLLPDGGVVPASSYALVAGADLGGGSVARASVDPARLDLTSAASLSVQSLGFYQPGGGTFAAGQISGGLLVDQQNTYSSTTKPSSGAALSMAEWMTYITASNFTGQTDTSVAVLYIGTTTASTAPNRSLILQLFGDFAAAHNLQLNNTDANVGWRRSSLTATDATTTFIAMSVKNFKLFVNEKLIPNLAALEANLRPTATNPALTRTVAAGRKTMVRPLVRTGTGDIAMLATGNVDLTNGPLRYVDRQGQITTQTPTSCSACAAGQLGGVPVYTAGHRAAPLSEILPDPMDPRILVQVRTPTPAASIFTTGTTYDYGTSTPAGIMVADTLNLTGGGDITVGAGGSVLSRRDLSSWIVRDRSSSTLLTYAWTGVSDFGINSNYAGDTVQPWRVVNMTVNGLISSTINPQLFWEGIGALGGGDISVSAGGSVSDLLTVIDTSLMTLTATPTGATAPTNVLVTVGGGNLAVEAAGDILANRADVASGTLRMSSGGSIGAGGLLPAGLNVNYRYYDLNNTLRVTSVPIYASSETQVSITDATVDLSASGDISLRGITQLDGFYSDASELNLLASGSVTITNTLQTRGRSVNNPGSGSYAVYPGTLNVASLTGDVNLTTFAPPPGSQVFNNDPRYAPASYNPYAPNSILMVPSPKGQLSILAADDVGATSIAMLDMDPYYLPGLFTLGGRLTVQNALCNTCSYANDAYQWASVGFPGWKSNLSDPQLKRMHSVVPTHAGDDKPVYVYAGRDIGNGLVGANLSLPKQARVYAGRDILNMMFFGQNLTKDDTTRIVAGRDITGVTKLSTLTQSVDGRQVSVSKPTLLGNTFILGGPGELMIEAGRNLGPFLNSAQIVDTSNFLQQPVITFPGGVVSVGNDWNPYLEPEGANITVQFGVGKGADYVALRNSYVAPGSANKLGDYASKLVDWMKKNASEALATKFGTTDVSSAQAYEAFLTLPEVRQRAFLVDVVYFGELRAPAEKDGPSYLKYSRGYTAVNTLFPAELGYTKNGLEGGAKSDSIVHTGDLDLRLASIESLYGGNINVLGPGGRVLAGSVVATAQQAARRYYAGSVLFKTPTSFGGIGPIVAIPPGYEGVLTQRGGHINTFTDGDFVLNQSRLFTVGGDDITMWSSNADLNAGQGAKTTPNFPPVNVRIDDNAVSHVDRTSATSGAGIAAYPPKDKRKKPPTVYLLAPRGTVDAGDAGVRAVNLSVAAFRIANADNFRVTGVSIGIPTFSTPDQGALTTASNTTAAVAPADPAKNTANAQPAVIIVEILGFGGGEGESREKEKKAP